MTLTSDMVLELRDHGFDDTTVFTDSRLLSFLNDTYLEFCALEVWPFLEVSSASLVTTVGNKVLITPTDLRAVLGIVNTTTGRIMNPERRETMVKQFASSLTTRGEPGFYYPLGQTINLMRIPDAVYALQFDYVKRPAALTTVITGGLDSTPIFPVDHHRVLVLGALSRANSMDNDPATSAFYDQLYQGKIQKIRNDLWGWQYDRPDRIVDIFSENDAFDY